MEKSKAGSGRNQSVWAATATMPSYAPLEADTTADVCVVGAGIAGLTTAYLLTQAGKSVVVLEKGELAAGMTQVTTAHLANALDDRYTEIERLHGEAGAKLAAESHTAAIDRIEMIARTEGIDCDFLRVDGYLFLSPEHDEQLLDDELAAARRAGLRNVEKIRQAPIASFDTGPCLRFPAQGQFHPLKYLAGLARAIERGGGHIHPNSKAEQIEGGPPARVRANGHTVTAGSVVVATNTPVNDMVVIHTKQAPYMTYVIGATVPRGSVERALYWDTEDPYHYVRLQPLGDDDTGSTGAGTGAAGPGATTEDARDLLIVGGEDHKTGQADDTLARHARLEEWTRQRFPMIEDIAFTWAGQVMETIDGVALIGRNPLDTENVFVVTGDSGMGMTHGTIAGMLLTDLIMGRENAWATLYDPSRKTMGAAGEFAKENVNVAAQYADWVTGGDVSSPDEIPKGWGAVIRRGLSKVAVYRDDEGAVHERSAVCPHLGCIVHWNANERTWDCPCHGSRFEPRGKVFNGPANSDLGKV